MDKHGSLLERARYAFVKMLRDAIVAGTGVSAASVVAFIVGDSVDPEVATGVGLVALAGWRIGRDRVLRFLEDHIAGDGGVNR